MKIAIISDIHANYGAFKAVWAKIKKYKIILNAGDLTGGYTDVNEVIDFISKNGKQIKSILGNNDVFLIKGKMPVSFQPILQKSLDNALKIITPKNLEYIKSLKIHEKFNLNGKKIGIYHGTPKSVSDYIYPDSSIKRFKNSKFDYIILGHTHHPMIREINGKIIINPGSVGQPRDGDTRASYAILDTKSGKVEIKRIKYNPKPLVEKIKKLKFSNELIKILLLEDEKN